MRDYQKECIEVIENTFKKYDRQLIQLPTGSGKTWIFSQYLAKNSDRALIICPSVELKEQIINTAKTFGISSISHNLRDFKKNHVIASHSLSFEKNYDLINSKNYDHIVIDEAHHAQSSTYQKFLNSLKSRPKILGCTATPERLDGKSLLSIFERISYEKNIYNLIKDGFLADIEAYRIKTMQDLSKRGSLDFRQLELKQLDNESRNNIIIKTFIDNCLDKKTLIFCLNVEHSIKISELLKKEGFNSAFIHGKMKKKERQETLKKFKSGDIQVLTNCQLLTEGFDEPSIEALIISRPTASKALYCQMIGRGLRKTSTKDICYLYELTDNNHKLCTFNVTCDKQPEFQREYRQGIRLSELYKEIEKITLDEVIFQKETMELFINNEILAGNAVDVLNSKFYDIKPTDYQLIILDLRKIEYHPEINYLEAAFLIWKDNLRKKYGCY